MPAQVVQLHKKNKLSYPHIICGTCEGNEFRIATYQGEDGRWIWQWLVCVNCNSYIPVNMSPVWGPGESEKVR